MRTKNDSHNQHLPNVEERIEDVSPDVMAVVRPVNKG